MQQPGATQRTFLKDIETEANIGLHPWEQFKERPTRLLVSVELISDVLVSFDPDVRHEFIDYDVVRDYIRALKNRPHVMLIEALLHDIVTLCMTFDRLTACRVAVRKPDIFNDVDEAGVEVYLTKAEYLSRSGGGR
jgi:dihydroneopterin aldolase